MDDFLKEVQILANLAEERKTPYYDAQAIMSSVSGLLPETAEEEYSFGFLAVLTASAAAVALVVLSYASTAWLDLKNPFVALDSLTNTLKWL